MKQAPDQQQGTTPDQQDARPSRWDRMRPYAAATGAGLRTGGKKGWSVSKWLGRNVVAPVLKFCLLTVPAFIAAEIIYPAGRAIFASDAPKEIKAFKWTLLGGVALCGYGMTQSGSKSSNDAAARPVYKENIPGLDGMGSLSQQEDNSLMEAFFGPAIKEQAVPRAAQNHVNLLASFQGLGERRGRETVNDFINKNVGFTNNGRPFDIAKIPWCALMITAIECASGRPGLRTALAVDYLKYGTDSTNDPREGDISVYTRRNDKGEIVGGHVAYYRGPESRERDFITGGNQNEHAINTGTGKRSSLLGIRRPPYEQTVNYNPCLGRK